MADQYAPPISAFKLVKDIAARQPAQEIAIASKKQLDQLRFAGRNGTCSLEHYGLRLIESGHANDGFAWLRIYLPGIGDLEGRWRIDRYLRTNLSGRLCRFDIALRPIDCIHFRPFDSEFLSASAEALQNLEIAVQMTESGETASLLAADAIKLIAGGQAVPIAPTQLLAIEHRDETALPLRKVYQKFVTDYPHVRGFASLEQLAAAAGCSLPAMDWIRSDGARERVHMHGPVGSQGGYLKSPKWQGLAPARPEAALYLSGIDPVTARAFFDAYIPFLTRAARHLLFRALALGDLEATGDKPGDEGAKEPAEIGTRLWEQPRIFVNASGNTVSRLSRDTGEINLLYLNVTVRETPSGRPSIP